MTRLSKRSILLFIGAALTLAFVAAGCGGGGGGGGGAGGGGGGTLNTASACSTFNGYKSDFLALRSAYAASSAPSKSIIDKVASDMQQFAGEAPADIKAAVQTEASTYSQFGKTEDNSVLSNSAFTSAVSKVGAWYTANCK